MRNKTLTMMLAVLMSMTASVVSADEHEYVDLGLPSGTLWATCNIGASIPEGYGDYFAWGETTTKSVYNWSTLKYCKGSEATMTKYCNNSSYGYNGFTDTLTELELIDDAAYVNWGSDWCMPSQAQLEELINSNYTTIVWIIQDGVNGRKITSKSNGNSIFLPAAGMNTGSVPGSMGKRGYYWSRSLYTSSPCHGWRLDFNSSEVAVGDANRFDGRPIRPVRRPIPATGISLNYDTYTLNRIGKSVQLVATVLPENATNKKVTWKSFNEAVCVVSDGLVVSTGEGTTVVSATTEDGEHVAYCSIKVELLKCATPTIAYKDGKLTFSCDTEGAQFVSEITDTDIKKYNEAEIDLSVTYTIRVHATHPEYYDSEEVVATLCWIETDPKMEYIETGVKEMTTLPVLIQSCNGTLHITGAEDGLPVSVYTISGQLLGTATVHGHEASVGTNIHNGIAVVKIGNRSVKVVVK